MTERDRWRALVEQKLQEMGKQYEQARREFEEARTTAETGLPTDDEGRVRIVCRRHAEKRAVRLDSSGRPACFEAGHTDCEGCVEDIEDETIETW